MKPVWIVDDDASIRWVLEKALAKADLPCRAFENAQQVMKALQVDTPQVLVSDIRMPGDSGLELLEMVKARLPDLPVIIMTGFSDLDSAVSAFQGGAFEYLPKPFDVAEATALITRAARESESVVVDRQDGGSPQLDMLGQAPAMQDVFRAIGRLSQSAATVLITGESGTGKELVAQALHRHSPRSGKPFVALNTAAIPHELLESELFGHERGSFTGAQTQRKGRFEQADGGTLFLDEIGDMPFDLQTRLLRVLSDGTFYRVGGQSPIRANVRVIAATHQDLESRVRDGRFREDLFHRLHVIRLRLPALRERREDIPELARYFLGRSARSLGVEPRVLSESAIQVLAQHPFPGNVRQLENLCHWLTVMAPTSRVGAEDLPPEFTSPVPRQEAHRMDGDSPMPRALEPVASSAVLQQNPADAWSTLLEQVVEKMVQSDRQSGGQQARYEELHHQFERAVFGTALRQCRGRRLEVAAVLGVGRNTVTRKIQELGLEED